MNEEWTLHAACRSIPTEAFFPVGEKGTRDRGRQLDAPLAICRRCPVRPDCARAALKRGVAHGVFAGIDLGDNSSVHKPSDEIVKRLRRIAEGA